MITAKSEVERMSKSKIVSYVNGCILVLFISADGLIGKETRQKSTENTWQTRLKAEPSARVRN